MQIDQFSQEPARLRMLTVQFHGTFFTLEFHSEEIGNDYVIDDIIKSKSRSNFWTAVTLLIYKLHRRMDSKHVVIILPSTGSLNNINSIGQWPHRPSYYEPLNNV